MKKLLIALSLIGLNATQVNAAVQKEFEPATNIATPTYRTHALPTFRTNASNPYLTNTSNLTILSNSNTVSRVQDIESMSAKLQINEQKLLNFTENMSVQNSVPSFATSANTDNFIASNTTVARMHNSAPPAIAAARAARAARSRTVGLCAKYVRKALQAAGYRITPNASAYQYATRGTLKKAGFTKISNSSSPQVGDVVVFNRTSKHPHGHIQIFDGRRWVSDFKQKNKSPYSGGGYTYTTWRDARYLDNASNKGVYLAMGK